MPLKSDQQEATAVRQFTTPGGRSLDFTRIGFGTAPLGNMARAIPEKECDEILQTAWNVGMRYFDTAPLYGLGLSEQRLSRLLPDKPRADYVLSSKVGRLLKPCAPDEVNGDLYVDTPQVKFVYDYSYDGVMRSYEESQKRLKIDRIDILYVHDVDSYNQGGREGSEQSIRDLMDTGGWKALQELRDNGAIDAIGAGVNEWEPCARLLEIADPDIFLLAGRYTLLEQAPLDGFFQDCEKRGVGIVIGGPYNSGILAGHDRFNYAAAPKEIIDRARALENVCKSHDVRLPQAAIQFVCAHPVVVSVIPGTQTVKETLDNVELLNSPIPSDLWAELKERGLIHPEAPTP